MILFDFGQVLRYTIPKEKQNRSNFMRKTTENIGILLGMGFGFLLGIVLGNLALGLIVGSMAGMLYDNSKKMVKQEVRIDRGR
jgi:F0F1-type ATP synthase assembly protein I